MEGKRESLVCGDRITNSNCNTESEAVRTDRGVKGALINLRPSLTSLLGANTSENCKNTGRALLWRSLCSFLSTVLIKNIISNSDSS